MVKYQQIPGINFEKIQDQLLSLYIESFSDGDAFQYHDADKTVHYLMNLVHNGHIHVANYQNEIIGAIIACALSNDESLPQSIKNNFQVEQSVYIAELMVSQQHRRKGIGKQLITEFLNNNVINNYTDVFIRVWIENKVAIALYKQFGFIPVAEITQSKLIADKSETHQYHKIYMHKKLINHDRLP